MYIYYIFPAMLFFYLFTCISPTVLSFYHLFLFHMPRCNIQVDMNRNQKDGAAFHIQLCPLLLSVSCYLQLLSIGAISLGHCSYLPAASPSQQKQHHIIYGCGTLFHSVSTYGMATIRATCSNCKRKL